MFIVCSYPGVSFRVSYISSMFTLGPPFHKGALLLPNELNEGILLDDLLRQSYTRLKFRLCQRLSQSKN